MYYDDHQPPHFHAYYGESAATFVVSDRSFLSGRVPPRVASLVREWLALHREEILINWEHRPLHRELLPIDPLE